MELTSILGDYNLLLETLKKRPIEEIDTVISLNKDLHTFSREKDFWSDLIRISYDLTRPPLWPSDRGDYITMQAIFSAHHPDPQVDEILEKLRQEEVTAWREGRPVTYFISENYTNTVGYATELEEMVPKEIYKARTGAGAVLKQHILSSELPYPKELEDRISGYLEEKDKEEKPYLLKWIEETQEQMFEITLPKLI